MKTYHLFISHSWTYGDQFDRLKKLLKERSYFDFIDHSIPKYDPVHSKSDKELYESIYRKMYSCHGVLLIAGIYTTYSRWIDKEVFIAKKQFTYPKPIIAIKPYGNDRISSVAGEHADVVVNWNTESIISAIRNYCR